MGDEPKRSKTCGRCKKTYEIPPNKTDAICMCGCPHFNDAPDKFLIYIPVSGGRSVEISGPRPLVAADVELVREQLTCWASNLFLTGHEEWRYEAFGKCDPTL